VIAPSEAVSLLVTLMGLPLVVSALRRIGMTLGRWMFIVAYCCVLAGQIFTILEGFALPDLFNIMEHFSYSAAGILFAVSVWRQTTVELGSAR